MSTGLLVVESEVLRRERGDDGGREERSGERDASHLLHHDHEVDETEAEAAIRLGHEEGRPAEADHFVPHRVGEAAIVVDHGPYIARRTLAFHERTHRATQFVLIRIEREIHYRSPKPDMGVMVR
jgi:hypothetical protein